MKKSGGKGLPQILLVDEGGQGGANVSGCEGIGIGGERRPPLPEIAVKGRTGIYLTEVVSRRERRESERGRGTKCRIKEKTHREKQHYQVENIKTVEGDSLLGEHVLARRALGVRLPGRPQRRGDSFRNTGRRREGLRKQKEGRLHCITRG